MVCHSISWACASVRHRHLIRSLPLPVLCQSAVSPGHHLRSCASASSSTCYSNLRTTCACSVGRAQAPGAESCDFGDSVTASADHLCVVRVREGIASSLGVSVVLPGLVHSIDPRMCGVHLAVEEVSESAEEVRAILASSIASCLNS